MRRDKLEQSLDYFGKLIELEKVRASAVPINMFSNAANLCADLLGANPLPPQAQEEGQAPSQEGKKESKNQKKQEEK
jgi:hypothetical protein